MAAGQKYRKLLLAVVEHLYQAIERALFSPQIRTDAVNAGAPAGEYTVRILYGSAFKNETFTTSEAAEARAEAIRKMGYPAEVFPPGPLSLVVADIGAAMKAVKVAVGSMDTQTLLARIREVGAGADRATFRKLGNSLGVNLRKDDPVIGAQIDQFAREGTDLIRSLAAEQVDDLLPRLLAAHEKGDRVEAIRAMIQERYGVAKSRATLIARDQIGKLNGKIVKVRHAEAGITEYIWSTSSDERVRPSHKALNGTRQRWDVPPAVGHPGEDIQCRCSAIPVIGGQSAEP